MKNYAIVIGALAVLIMGTVWAMSARVAKAPEGVATTTTTTSGTGTTSIGEHATVNGTTIGIISLVEDSRCPVDVQCIQAGTVRVRTSVNNHEQDFIFTLGQPQVVGDVSITLSSVVPPQKFSKVTVQPGDYRFTFTVVPVAI